jgi:hypothetical protein
MSLGAGLGATDGSRKGRKGVCPPESVRRGTGVMNRSKIALGVATAVSAVTLAGQRQASACGGCFQPTQTISDITDERMLLSVSAAQSTLYDQITYSGSPSSFAWVLPIHGTVTVGLSADVLFNSVDAVTRTQINPPPQNCPSPNCGARKAGAPAPAAGGATTAPMGSVTVLAQANVGPYATVQLHSTDSSALDAWLAQNGYNIPAAVQPILDAYVKEGSDFLAMKLLPNQGVQAMRPVRVTTPGAGLSLPLRMASIGTGAVTGITIWVVADGRYEPQNFPVFHIDDSQLVWDWSSNISNYSTLRLQRESALKNAGWEIESSIAVNEQVIKNVIMSGGQYYGNGLGPGAAPVNATQDYLPIGSADAGAGAGGYESADQVRDDDINTLFAGLTGSTVRVTRIRSDIAQTAMTADFVLQAAADQSELSNVRTVTQSVNLTCPIYNGCNVTGMGTLAQAQASVDDGGMGGSGSSGNPVLGAGGVPSRNGAGVSGSMSTPPAANGGSGCAAAPRATGSGVAFGALASVLGLVIGRLIRVRRRRARSSG